MEILHMLYALNLHKPIHGWILSLRTTIINSCFKSTKLFLFSIASQWLPYSTVNLTLPNILKHDRWAQHTTQGDKMHTS